MSEYTISPDGGSITCHRCGLTSYHPMDVAHRYCGGCHRFHTDAAAVAVDLDALRARMQRDGITEDDLDLLFALLTVQQQRGDTAEFKATILQAQIGGWEAACAAQVAAIRRALPSLIAWHDSTMDAIVEDLEIAIDTNVGETLLRQLTRAEAVATSAAIALYEIDSIGALQPHTRSLLAAAVDAYEAGKAGPP
jgi:hypothetical protein